MKITAKKNLSLEGLRGLAAFSVLCSHILFAFLPYLAHHLTPNNVISRFYDFEEILSLPVFTVFFNGVFGVSVFFVLSGYVITKSFFAIGDVAVLQQYAAKRYPRIVIPVAVSVMFGWVLLSTGAMHNQVAAAIHAAGWPMLQYTQPVEFATALWQAIYGAPILGQSDLNSPLWTIRIEILGSLLVFATYGLFGARSIFVNILVFGTFTLLLNKGSYEALHYFALFAGSLIHYIERFIRGRSWIGAALLILGMMGGAFDYSHMFGFLHDMPLPSLPFPLFNMKAWEAERTLYNSVGAVFLLCGVLACAPAARALSHRIPVYLGRISYSMYLLHWPIICSFSYWSMDVLMLKLGVPYLYSIACTGILSILVVILASELFQRYIDSPAIRLGDMLAEILFRARPAIRL